MLFIRTACTAALVATIPAPAGAQLLCTMPNGVTITKNLGDCPTDATMVRKQNGEIVRDSTPRPSSQPGRAAGNHAKPQPAPTPAPQQQPSAYEMAQLACTAFRQAGASECTVDSSVFSTSYINTTIATSPYLAAYTCKDVAATMRQATSAFRGAAWEIRIYHPFSGQRPIASCQL